MTTSKIFLISTIIAFFFLWLSGTVDVLRMRHQFIQAFNKMNETKTYCATEYIQPEELVFLDNKLITWEKLNEKVVNNNNVTLELDWTYADNNNYRSTYDMILLSGLRLFKIKPKFYQKENKIIQISLK